MTPAHLFDLPAELPDDPSPPPALFEVPDDGSPIVGTTTGDVPPAEPVPVLPDAAIALTGQVLPPIGELTIQPDLESYLAALEQAVAPYEAAARQFAREMETAPVDTPEQVAAIGRMSLVARDRERALEELFEPCIRKPRLYLDRVYAVRRRVVDWWKIGGQTAAARHARRRRELEELDRRVARDAAAADAKRRQEAEAQAAAERQRLAEAATRAATAGDTAAASHFIDQARAVQPALVPDTPVLAVQTAQATVKGVTVADVRKGDITDLVEALLAYARPHIMLEIAAAIEAGELTAAAMQTPTTIMVATRLRALASELPQIPSSMFQANAKAIKARATDEGPSLQWPGFRFWIEASPRRTSGGAA
jgi:hypothetical protein